MKFLKRNKILSVVIATAILCLAPTANTYAVTPMIGHKYVNGVSNVSVWINYASGVGYWQTYITSGMNNWMYPGWSNPIYMNTVSSNYGSMMDFHMSYNSYYPPGTTIYANTELYQNGGTQVVSPWPVDWNYAEIRINNDTFSLPSFTNAMAQGTVRHEMGHAFGLKHWSSPVNVYSIMAQIGEGRAVQSVQLTDNDSINIIY